jgi:hypothetical protein
MELQQSPLITTAPGTAEVYLTGEGIPYTERLQVLGKSVYDQQNAEFIRKRNEELREQAAAGQAEYSMETVPWASMSSSGEPEFESAAEAKLRVFEKRGIYPGSQVLTDLEKAEKAQEVLAESSWADPVGAVIRYLEGAKLSLGDDEGLPPAVATEVKRKTAERTYDVGMAASVIAGMGAVAREAATLAAEGVGVRATTGFVADATVVSRGQVIGRGNVDVRATVEAIESGRLAPRNVFQNRPLPGKTTPELPAQPPGYYQEFVHPTPGVSGVGPQRIVRGQGGELFYTPDHYKTFIPIN